MKNYVVVRIIKRTSLVAGSMDAGSTNGLPFLPAFEAFANGLPFLPSIRVEEALRMAGATDLSVGECVLFTLFSFLLLSVLYTSSSSS